MKAVGIIVEYNPFHNGHLYHIQKAKELTDADTVVAVMSGPFLQRGEPAIVSKWLRTEMALENGVDIVIELPYIFATQHAEIFAKGAVALLESLKCDYLCFGSESGDLDSFIDTYQLLNENRPSLDVLIKRFVQLGNSYAKSMFLAFEELIKNEQKKYLDLSKPNNILGLEYVKAVCSTNSNIKLVTIPRKNANYHDEHFTSDTIASATSIRKELFTMTHTTDCIQSYVPLATSHLLNKYYEEYSIYHHWENYWPFLKFRLLQISREDLKNIYEVEEGLENRLLSYVKKAHSFEHFLSLVKTKRYTWTRLQRLCLHILTNTNKQDIRNNLTPSYIRLLGSTSSGRLYLKEKKKIFTLPIVSKLSAFDNTAIQMDIKAASVYALGVPLQHQQNLLDAEYRQPPIIK